MSQKKIGIMPRVLFCWAVLAAVTGLAAPKSAPQTSMGASAAEPVVDYFVDQPLQRWVTIAGRWQAQEMVEVANVEQRTIYRSPEEPSHVAWVGMWQGPDGSISIRFPQITSNPGLESSYAPWYGRNNFADYAEKNWAEEAAAEHLIVGPPDAVATTKLHYITMITHDGGNSWQKVSEVEGATTESKGEARGYNSHLVLTPTGSLVGNGVATLLCRDGRIIDTAGGEEVDKEDRAGRHHLLGLRESFDNGKTWSPLQWVSGNYANGKPVVEATEEHSVVELDDCRLLFIIRADEVRYPLAAWLTRHSDGRYTCDTPVVITSMPHAGKPSMVRTSDGTIWYWGARHFYSLDAGKTWQGLPDSQVFPSYYGKMLASGNHVLCITQKDVGDDPYPPLRDASVEQLRFSGRRVGVIEKTSPEDSSGILMLKDREFTDLHLRVDLHLDVADGIAFRVSPDGKSYYALMVVMPDTEARKRWAPPASQGATLSAYFPGMLDSASHDELQKGIVRIAPRPMAVLARVDNGHLTVLRGVNTGEAHTGSWVEVQIKVRGDLIQAAVSNGASPPNYLGVRDATYTQGAIGLLSGAGSKGGFRDLSYWSSPQMMHDLWTITPSASPLTTGWASGTGASKPY